MKKVPERSLIILPTLNEKENALTLIASILVLEFVTPVDIVVVDDDSEDGTAESVAMSFRNEPRVKVINRRGKERGLTNSLSDGIAMSDHDIILWLDADLQMYPGTLTEILCQLVETGSTAVIGSRFIFGGGDFRDRNGNFSIVSIHRMLSLILNVVSPAVLSLPFTDVTSGLIAIRRDFFLKYSLEGDHGEYFMALANELHRSKQRVCEVPYLLLPRSRGDSKSTGGSWRKMFHTGLKYLRLLGRLYFRNKGCAS